MDSTRPDPPPAPDEAVAAAVSTTVPNQVTVEETLRHSEQRFRSLVEATSSIIWTTGPDGRVVQDAPSWRTFTGQSYEAWTGYGWLDAIHPDDRERAQAAWADAVQRGASYEVRYRLRRHDGVYRETLARGVPVLNDDGTVREWVGCNVDISDQQQAQRALEQNGELVGTLNRLGMLLNAELDLERLVQAITDAATELSGAQFGAFFYNLTNAAGESYTLYTISGVAREHFSKFPMPRNTRVFAPTFNGEGVVRVDDITKDPRYGHNPPHRGMPEGHLPVRSYLAVPVISRSGSVIGGLFFGHQETGVFSEQSEKLVVGLAAQAAVAMDNAHLFREVENARRDSEAERARLDAILSQAPVAIALTRGPEHRFEMANDAYRKLAGRDPTGRTIREAFPELEGQGIYELLDGVLRTGKPYIGNELEAELIRSSGVREPVWFNLIYHPLRNGKGDIEGVVVIAVDVTAQVTARRKVEELVELQKRDQALLARHAKQLELSANVNAAVAQSENTAQMLLRCTQALVQPFDAAACGIWLLDEAEQRLELQASAGIVRFDALHLRVPVGAMNVGRIAVERTPRLTHQLVHEVDHPDHAWVRREGLTAFAGYPLLSDGRTLGVVGVFSLRELPLDVLTSLSAVADAVSSGVARKRAEEERRRAEEALQAQSAMIRAITDNATLGLVMMDARQHCTFMNPAAEKIFGLSFEEVKARGVPLHDVIHHTHPDGRHYPMEECPIDRALPKRNQEQGEDVFVRPDGSFYPVAFTASPLLENGRPVGTVIEVRDITRERELQSEREQLIRTLERSNRELDQFAYVASHDLKAPLRGIANLSNWLEEDMGRDLTEDNREKMRLLRGRVHRMEALIDGILDYSRAGRIRHAPEAVDVRRLVEDVVELLAPRPEAKITVSPELPTLTAERIPLQQVFLNLVGNALKHARRDDIRVEVTTADEGALQRFSVRDNGQGIAPEFQDRIWGIFQTLEARDKVEGTGIGLSVVQKTVETRGGRAWVESVPGRGATFHFTWPKTADTGHKPS